ncbi:uncharacterized protein LY89DRAFT_663622 [Mollisia scopiformis]|uniref:Uncharacterized protein n=1 Tax=Mollisia scopiformis TaxID=149040 RepID=A0A194XSZ3_MOLSC|nr:uncharacterized protein LY89DRAFT_663622 [Mollisia scopiformis]KUJ23159.1 hypothetical protein LY89DRAFT_663622 [Mollisia scopiformis]
MARGKKGKTNKAVESSHSAGNTSSSQVGAHSTQHNVLPLRISNNTATAAIAKSTKRRVERAMSDSQHASGSGDGIEPQMASMENDRPAKKLKLTAGVLRDWAFIGVLIDEPTLEVFARFASDDRVWAKAVPKEGAPDIGNINHVNMSKVELSTKVIQHYGQDTTNVPKNDIVRNFLSANLVYDPPYLEVGTRSGLNSSPVYAKVIRNGKYRSLLFFLEKNTFDIEKSINTDQIKFGLDYEKATLKNTTDYINDLFKMKYKSVVTGPPNPIIPRPAADGPRNEPRPAPGLAPPALNIGPSNEPRPAPQQAPPAVKVGPMDMGLTNLQVSMANLRQAGELYEKNITAQDIVIGGLKKTVADQDIAIADLERRVALDEKLRAEQEKRLAEGNKTIKKHEATISNLEVSLKEAGETVTNIRNAINKHQDNGNDEEEPSTNKGKAVAGSSKKKTAK